MNSPFINIYKNEKEKILIENEYFFCIKPLSKQSKTHIIIIPKREIEERSELLTAEEDVLKELIGQITKQYGEVKTRITPPNKRKIRHLHIHVEK